MAVLRNNVVKCITDSIINSLSNTEKVVVWYGGNKLLSIVNDALNILGKSVSYVIVDEEISEEYKLNYAWNIPLINKHISVDISKSELLSEFHINKNQPKAVSVNIIDKLQNEGIYVICSTHADNLKKHLNCANVDKNNIVEVIEEQKCIHENDKNMKDSFSNMHEMSLEEIHAAEYELLVTFTDFCENHGLRYYLAGGTMLGAVRHKGFIPWDDDIDVFMPDEDYLQFIMLYKDDNKYEVLNYRRNEEYPFFFSKLANKTTKLWHYGYPMSYVMGIYIDIFPLVGFPSEEREQRKQWDLEHLTMAEWYWYQDVVDIVGRENMPITKENIVNKLKLPKFDESDYVGPISVILQKEWVNKKEIFDKYIYADFEQGRFRIPCGFDAHLTSRYGEYMKMPPAEKRVCHSFPMFKEVK